MLEVRDIAPMKLKAVVQRGSKKDFYDVFYLLDHISLRDMIDLFQRKFHQREVFHVIKSLTYFEDAEGYADPVVFDDAITWRTVKATISESIKTLL